MDSMIMNMVTIVRPYVLKTGKNMLKTHKKRLKMCL